MRMEPKYRYSESTVKQEAIQIDGGTVYLRTDISKVTRTDEQGNKVVFWTYQEAKLTPDEFNAYASLVMSRNAIVGVNDSGNISQLIIGQENEGVNQLIIMEAIADLYDVLASLM